MDDIVQWDEAGDDTVPSHRIRWAGAWSDRNERELRSSCALDGTRTRPSIGIVAALVLAAEALGIGIASGQTRGKPTPAS